MNCAVVRQKKYYYWQHKSITLGESGYEEYTSFGEMAVTLKIVPFMISTYLAAIIDVNPDAIVRLAGRLNIPLALAFTHCQGTVCHIDNACCPLINLAFGFPTRLYTGPVNRCFDRNGV